jgi:hypothetical protein
VTATASPSTICPGGSSTLTANGNANVYQWNTGQTGQTITVSPSATTTYFVAGYNSFNCRTIAQVDVTVDASACSGTPSGRVASASTSQTNSQTSEGGEISVYPNPSQGVFYVANVPTQGNVEVYNSMGERILLVVPTSGDDHVKVDITGRSSGMYILRVRNQTQVVHQARVIMK